MKVVGSLVHRDALFRTMYKLDACASGTASSMLTKLRSSRISVSFPTRFTVTGNGLLQVRKDFTINVLSNQPGVRLSGKRSAGGAANKLVCKSPLSPTRTGQSAEARAVAGQLDTGKRKIIWLWTHRKDVMTAAVEAGWDTFIFTDDVAQQKLAEAWTSMARIQPLTLKENLLIKNNSDIPVATYCKINTAAELAKLSELMGRSEPVVMDPQNWQVIPAENIVAAFQHSSTPILVTANSATDARVALQALERGTDGVVLRTDEPAEVFKLKEYLLAVETQQGAVSLTPAVVTKVEAVGMGERVCVDLCSLLQPGEGLLVGSFARALFLVHSECLQADYVASRPFRVNAGPVHAYVAAPGGRTAYLSELRTGVELLVVDPRGHSRTALVGRTKIESRPLMLVEAEVEAGGQRHSLLLQNAETVRLVTPDKSPVGGHAISVSELKIGDTVLLALQESVARHTGIAVQEYIVEC